MALLVACIASTFFVLDYIECMKIMKDSRFDKYECYEIDDWDEEDFDEDEYPL